MRNADPRQLWAIVLAASQAAERLSAEHRDIVCRTFTRDGRLELAPASPSDPDAPIAWRRGAGWEVRLPPDDPGRPLLDLYLPLCGATAARPITVAHLGQSLDGFIATHAGESRWVTGEENMRHMHRLRALCDAVIVGPGTVAADDPLLTTRLVTGPNPLRVVLDPSRRLGPDHRVFTDDQAETLYICAASAVKPGETRFGRASIACVAGTNDGIDPADVIRLLRARGCARVFIEGGGVTVSRFLQANVLDRLHVTIAPLLIGAGRPAIRLPAPAALGDCHRPTYRVFRMGGDVLFDCDVRAKADAASDDEIARVI